MNREELLQKAISTYGINSQLDMAVEEMSELTKEICKRKRGKENRAEILEEIADVKIVLEQLKIIFCISDDDIERMVTSKLDRLRIRLERVTADD
ncbi:MAG: hypothetical protein RSF33_07255 [Hydrogenoanaerobacterium sp.]